MRMIFTGNHTTDDGVSHSEAVAMLYQLNVFIPQDQLQSKADVIINYYHNQSAMLSGKREIDSRPYLFTVEGEHPFEEVFIAGQDSQANLANYLSGLPEFDGWTPSVV